MEGLTQRFLEGLAEIINTLNSEVNSVSLNPTIAILSALILTATASFSSEPKIPLLILAISIALMMFVRSSIYSWIKIIFFITLWATVISIPLLFITHEPIVSLPLNLWEIKISGEGLETMLVFIIRVTASASIFTSFAFILGWRKIISGLEGLRIPREIIFLLTISIINIPLFLREASKMLSAREVRIIRKFRLQRIWTLLATVIGDLLLKSNEHAWRLGRAIKARSFMSHEFSSKTPTILIEIKDLALLSLALCVLVIGLAVGL